MMSVGKARSSEWIINPGQTSRRVSKYSVGLEIERTIVGEELERAEVTVAVEHLVPTRDPATDEVRSLSLAPHPTSAFSSNIAPHQTIISMESPSPKT